MSYGFGGGGRVMVDATMGQKAEMQGLNDRLAQYMQKLNDLKMAGSGAIDPAKYRDAMQMLENELMKIKNMYESELDRLRRQLEDANREKNNMAGNLDRNSGAYNDMASKLAAATDNLRKLQDETNNLRRALADKEKENVDLRAMLKAKDTELDQLRPNYGRMNNDIDALRRQLEQETKRRQEAEDKLRELLDKMKFGQGINDQENKDLKDRLQVANDICQKLEQKIRQLTQDGGDDLAKLLQKLRDSNMAELRKYQRETEDALNKNLGSLRSQMMDADREREKLARERASADDAIKQLQKRISDLEGENSGLKQQLRNLMADLDREKTNANRSIRDLENKNRDLQGAMMNSTKEFNDARGAQATLRSEIDQYRNLLDLGSHKMADGSRPTTGTGPTDGMRPRTAMASAAGGSLIPPPPGPAYGRPPTAPPPQYNNLQFRGPQANATRISAEYRPQGPQTEYTDRYRNQTMETSGLPNISGLGQSGYTRTQGTYNPTQRVYSY